MNDGRTVAPGPPLPLCPSVEAVVLSTLRRTLGLDDDAPIQGDESFFDLGIDSVAGEELVGSPQANLSLDMPNTLLFDYPTLDALKEISAQELQERGTKAAGANGAV